MDVLNRNSLVFKQLKKAYCLASNLLFEQAVLFRKLGISFRHKKLKTYKNIHKGERCFIIATGPSLTMEDLKKLEHEKTIGMNSLAKVFGEIGWETTYYGIQDYRVYRKLKKDIEKLKETTILLGDIIKDKGNLNTEYSRFPVNFLNHRYDNVNLTRKFSDDCYLQVYDGYSIAYSLVQIAAYMGFEEIYLIGTDCSYSEDKSKQHFVESGHYSRMPKEVGNRMIHAYGAAKEYADKKGIKIYNATRGGMLEVFERADLDQVLNKN
ncbi:DUF115 domain-containing protein [Rossellomorea vietnamensis]|uniref:DUF115 domain-containing protein n=1 Tax=Rossellomorea vietnamensis TaxID=218284 RepID=A0A5D4M2U0_9BACI|nr:6-hydroxymethylpterin diphosphokinase MptE-like protein [Rossellomorea vietnamensis]TYR95912.1 DUF115 domain-containing protein [Rossellomorea vietnamensis]